MGESERELPDIPGVVSWCLCGAVALMESCDNDVSGSDGRFFYVQCMFGCCRRGPMADNKDEARELWLRDMRALRAHDALVEALKAMHGACVCGGTSLTRKLAEDALAAVVGT